jgi:hypothetical protein
MRTTLTIDDDLATKLRQLAHRRRMSFKEVVNAVIRRGLAAQVRGSDRPQPFRVEPFRSAFRAGVDPMRLNQLADELEAEHFVTRSRPTRRDGAA